MKRLGFLLMTFCVLLFMAAPVFAGPLDWLSGPLAPAVNWIADALGVKTAAINWSLAGLVTLAAGFILKRYDVEKWGLAFHRAGWFGGRAVSARAKTIKFISGIWDKALEPFLIKTVMVIPHLIMQLINGFIAGLLSDNKRPNVEKK